uniref:RRM domain-containing protein n=2 Tax=Leersia perrieri TaxID=77586 RepID=A0A0D9X3U3_9ORYZ
MAVVETSAAPPAVDDAPAAAESAAGEGDSAAAGEREMRDLEDLLSKLNPMAEEFVPPSLASSTPLPFSPAAAGYYPNGGFASPSPTGPRAGVVGFLPIDGAGPRAAAAGRKKGGGGGGFAGGQGHPGGKRRMNSRTSMAQRDEVIRRTVYVSDIDHQVTEEQLAALFINCGQVVDCRMCGDPNSVLRFAFIEFTDEESARAALNLSGTVLGYYPVRVLPSKTAIAPVNPTFLPRSDDEREMCARTIYCTNIDKKVSQADVKLFFESICGEVYRLRLLGDFHHSTRIAFVEFVMAESATAALNCSGVILGSLPIRVSPSKTPVRPRAPRQLMH